MGAALGLVAAWLGVAPALPAAAGLRPITLGFGDQVFCDSSAAVRATWDARAVAAGAKVVRVNIGWDAPRRPAHPADPADPAYDFTNADACVRDATARGLEPMLLFTVAPAWAEGPRRPRSAAPGTWLPDPAAVGAYGHALALRYDGHYPDPLHPGTALPRVHLLQLWNEENLSMYLTPQWQRIRGRWVAVAPAHYRAMLNAFYAGVKSVQPGATVVTGGTAPFGDFGHGQRIMPVLFWRDVFGAKTSFDALAQHPYSIGAPASPALNADDVSIADMGKLSRLLRSAERRGTALPRIHHPLWVTEVGYDTKPPNPTGVPVGLDSRWVEQTLYLLWLQRVSVVTWYLIRDLEPIPNYGLSAQSGIYYLNGRPKPAALAFRFPVVGNRGRSGRVTVWVRAPASGRVVVQARAGARARGSWRAVATRGVHAGEVFEVSAPVGTGEVRASLGGLVSLVWRV